MGKLLLGSVIAAAAMFAWGFVFWVVAGVPQDTLKSVPDAPAAQAALKSVFPESGAYFIPDESLPQDEFVRLHEAGPRAFIHYNAEGAPAMAPATLLSGFLLNWVTCFLLGWLLLQTNTPGYLSRVFFLTVAGVTAALFIEYGAVIWFYANRPFQLVNMLSNSVSWLVAGLVLAWMPGSRAGARRLDDSLL